MILRSYVHCLKARQGCFLSNITGAITHGGLSHDVGFKPLSDTLQVQVDADQTELPAPFDQLIWLYHQPLQGGASGRRIRPMLKQIPQICINTTDTRLK